MKSAGTENSARIKISEKLIAWSDLIFVMEKRHKVKLKEKFANEIVNKEIIVLDIQDDYEYMNPDLIDLLKTSVSEYF